MAATPPQTVISPPANGGNGVIRTTTRRQLASNAAKPPPSPAWRAPRDSSPEGPAGAEGAGEIGRPGGGARRTRCPWAAGPGRTTSRRAERSSRCGRLAGHPRAHHAAQPRGRARHPERPRVHKQQPAPHSNTSCPITPKGRRTEGTHRRNRQPRGNCPRHEPGGGRRHHVEDSL